jgi:cupin 2 domain-containing protein
MNPRNLLDDIPADRSREIFETLVKNRDVHVERIVSRGHTSPEEGWYDQETNEWVLLLSGAGKLEFDDRTEVVLKPGDCIEIPTRTRHRVAWTDPGRDTVWLAIHYRPTD